MPATCFQSALNTWWQVIVHPLPWITGVLAFAWVIDRACGRGHPRARKYLWRLAHLKTALLLLPFLAIPLRSRGPETSPLPSAPWRLEWRPAHATEAAGFDVESGTPTERGRATEVPWATAAFVVWLLAAAGGLAKLVGRWRASQRFLAESQPISPDPVTETKLPIPRVVEFRSHPQLAGPLVIGFRRPVLVLPAEVWASFSPPERLAMIAHELAHLRHGDLFWDWLRQWLRVPLGFHPLTWIADHRARLADEATCDRAALAATSLSAGDYARLLVRVAAAGRERIHAASWRCGEPPMTATMSPSGRSLFERIQSLDEARASKVGRRIRLALGMGLTAVMLTFGAVIRRDPIRITELDPQIRVHSCLVSAGREHALMRRRARFSLAGMTMIRDVDSLETANRRAGDSPAEVQRVQFVGPYPALAFIVRWGDSSDEAMFHPLTAELVDGDGRVSRLVPLGEVVPSATGAAEFYQAWASPAVELPRGLYRLQLRAANPPDHLVARIELGTRDFSADAF